MDRYAERINLHGVTQRDRIVSRIKENIANKSKDNPSYKDVKLNGVDTSMIINSGTQPYYKTFTSLPDQEVLLGDYVEFADETWLVYSADSDDELYVDGDLRQCNHTMFWQVENGDIVSRKVWVQNASAYNNGVLGNQTIALQSNQFMIFMPYDKDTAYFGQKVGFRFNMTKEPSMCSAYELTRFDEITYAYGKKGMLNLILTQDQFNEETDKLVTLDDGTSVWICDYSPATPKPTPDESQILLANISGGDSLRCGRAKTWAVTFQDKDGNAVDCDFRWNLVGADYVTHNIDGTSIQLRVDDKSYIGGSFILQVIDNTTDSVVAENEITVISML